MKKPCKGKKSSCFIVDLMSLVQSAVAQNSTLFFNLVPWLSQTATNALNRQTLWLSAQINVIFRNPSNASKIASKNAYIPGREATHEDQILTSKSNGLLINSKYK